MTTNFGVTNAAGTVFGTIPRFSSEPVTVKPITPSNMTCTAPNSPTRVSGTPVNFTDPVVCNVNAPLVSSPTPERQNKCDGSQPVAPSGASNSLARSSSGARPQAVPTDASRVLLIAKDTFGFTTILENFKSGGSDASKTKLMVGNVDMTQKARFKTLENDSVEVSVKFREVLKAQANLEIKLETTKWGGDKVESKVAADVVAKVRPLPIRFVEIDEDDNAYVNLMLAQGSGTDEEKPSEFPFFVEADGEIKILYMENDQISLQDFEVPLFVTMEDERGQVLPIDTKPVKPVLGTQGVGVLSSSGFVAGIAEFTLRLNDPIAVNGVILTGGLDYEIASSSQGLRLQQLTCGAISLSGSVCLGASGTYRSPNAALTSRVTNVVRTSPSNDRVSTEISQRWAQYVSQVKPISLTVQAPINNGVCLSTAAATKPAASAAAKPYNMVRSNSAECEGTDTTRSVPQTRFNNKDPKSIPNKDERRAKYEIGIDVAWLQEASLVCRGDDGTRNWTNEERKKLWEARSELEKTLQKLGCKDYKYPGIDLGPTKACTNQKYVKAFSDFKDSIRQSGLYGKKAQRDASGNIKKDAKGRTLWDWSKYVGHHINSAACYDTSTDVPDNISFTDRDTHINTCHGGSYNNCTQGNLTDRESRYLETEQRVPRCEATPPTRN